MMPVKADLVFVALSFTRVWLSCQAIIGISVFAGLFRVFSNPVTVGAFVTALLEYMSTFNTSYSNLSVGQPCLCLLSDHSEAVL